MRVALRATCAVIYLGATGVWTVLMGVSAALRCDENCNDRGFHDGWRSNADAWQWSALGWLGLAGLALAIIALVLSRLRRDLGIAGLFAHAGIFSLNALIIWTSVNGFDPLVMGVAVLVVIAGAIAVGAFGAADVGRRLR